MFWMVVWCALLVGQAMLVGCGGTSRPLASEQSEADPFSNEPTVERMPGEVGRLADDVERAIKNIGWGKLSIVVHDGQEAGEARGDAPGDETVDEMVDVMEAGTVTASALTPRGYTARITVTPTTAKRASVSIFVEPFGHRHLQQDFVNELRRVLAGPARRVYRGDYRLPDQSPW